MKAPGGTDTSSRALGQGRRACKTPGAAKPGLGEGRSTRPLAPSHSRGGAEVVDLLSSPSSLGDQPPQQQRQRGARGKGLAREATPAQPPGEQPSQPATDFVVLLSGASTRPSYRRCQRRSSEESPPLLTGPAAAAGEGALRPRQQQEGAGAADCTPAAGAATAALNGSRDRECGASSQQQQQQRVIADTEQSSDAGEAGRPAAGSACKPLQPLRGVAGLEPVEAAGAVLGLGKVLGTSVRLPSLLAKLRRQPGAAPQAGAISGSSAARRPPPVHRRGEEGGQAQRAQRPLPPQQQRPLGSSRAIRAMQKAACAGAAERVGKLPASSPEHEPSMPAVTPAAAGGGLKASQAAAVEDSSGASAQELYPTSSREASPDGQAPAGGAPANKVPSRGAAVTLPAAVPNAACDTLGGTHPVGIPGSQPASGTSSPGVGAPVAAQAAPAAEQDPARPGIVGVAAEGAVLDQLQLKRKAALGDAPAQEPGSKRCKPSQQQQVQRQRLPAWAQRGKAAPNVTPLVLAAAARQPVHPWLCGWVPQASSQQSQAQAQQPAQPLPGWLLLRRAVRSAGAAFDACQGPEELQALLHGGCGGGGAAAVPAASSDAAAAAASSGKEPGLRRSTRGAASVAQTQAGAAMGLPEAFGRLLSGSLPPPRPPPLIGTQQPPSRLACLTFALGQPPAALRQGLAAALRPEKARLAALASAMARARTTRRGGLLPLKKRGGRPPLPKGREAADVAIAGKHIRQPSLLGRRAVAEEQQEQLPPPGQVPAASLEGAGKKRPAASTAGSQQPGAAAAAKRPRQEGTAERGAAGGTKRGAEGRAKGKTASLKKLAGRSDIAGFHPVVLPTVAKWIPR